MSITNAVKQKMISDYISNPQGRAKLAASMTQPLRLRRDYLSVGRKTFLVEQLPDGALPIYDKDPDVTAYVVGEEGENILAVTKPRRVIFPLFEIASNPEIPLTQIKERRFDLIERAQDLARSQIQAAEDERVFAVLDAIATNGFDSIAGGENADIPVVAPITGAVLADAFSLIERHDLRVARVFMNARDYADLRKFGRDILDIETQRDLLKTGLMGTLWGSQIIVSRLVPVGTVYVCCEPEMFGRIPVRTELTVLSCRRPEGTHHRVQLLREHRTGRLQPEGSRPPDHHAYLIRLNGPRTPDRIFRSGVSRFRMGIVAQRWGCRCWLLSRERSVRGNPPSVGNWPKSWVLKWFQNLCGTTRICRTSMRTPTVGPSPHRCSWLPIGSAATGTCLGSRAGSCSTDSCSRTACSPRCVVTWAT